jgi:hypothetical protein
MNNLSVGDLVEVNYHGVWIKGHVAQRFSDPTHGNAISYQIARDNGVRIGCTPNELRPREWPPGQAGKYAKMESLALDTYIQRAHTIAVAAAKESPPSYYTDPFQPHPWVITAVVNGIKEGEIRALGHTIEPAILPDGKLAEKLEGLGFDRPVRAESDHAAAIRIAMAHRVVVEAVEAGIRHGAQRERDVLRARIEALPSSSSFAEIESPEPLSPAGAAMACVEILSAVAGDSHRFETCAAIAILLGLRREVANVLEGK